MAAGDITNLQLLGLWRAEFPEEMRSATVLFELHRQFADSFSGEINRNGERARMVGDIEVGEFVMAESSVGARISATWIGDVVEGSCGREIRGTWHATSGRPPTPFILRKNP